MTSADTRWRAVDLGPPCQCPIAAELGLDSFEDVHRFGHTLATKTRPNRSQMPPANMRQDGEVANLFAGLAGKIARIIYWFLK